MIARVGSEGPGGSGIRLVVEQGTCLALFAYDVGLAIDLDAAERILLNAPLAAGQRESIRRTRRAPSYFEFKPAPLRVTRPAQAIELAGHRTLPSVDIVLYDFGAVSVAYAIPLPPGDLESLLPLGEALVDNDALLADSRARVSEVVAALGQAITRPELASFEEDYIVFQVTRSTIHPSPGGPDATLADVLAQRRGVLARILRAERADLSPQEVEDALSCRISYSHSDAALIDWNAALLFDPDPQDATAALEFANVELLEMRHLDDRLDAALDEVYKGFAREWARRRHPLARLRGAVPRASLRRIAALQIDAALLFEGVNNALKLLGDQYLARLYRQAAQRFHLPDWDQSILRKLATLDGIYQKLADRRSNRRMEILEWIIIALIAFEVAYSLLRK